MPQPGEPSSPRPSVDDVDVDESADADEPVDVDEPVDALAAEDAAESSLDDDALADPLDDAESSVAFVDGEVLEELLEDVLDADVLLDALLVSSTPESSVLLDDDALADELSEELDEELDEEALLDDEVSKRSSTPLPDPLLSSPVGSSDPLRLRTGVCRLVLIIEMPLRSDALDSWKRAICMPVDARPVPARGFAACAEACAPSRHALA